MLIVYFQEAGAFVTLSNTCNKNTGEVKGSARGNMGSHDSHGSDTIKYKLSRGSMQVG
jgi:hypothetical protein